MNWVIIRLMIQTSLRAIVLLPLLVILISTELFACSRSFGLRSVGEFFEENELIFEAEVVHSNSLIKYFGLHYLFDKKVIVNITKVIKGYLAKGPHDIIYTWGTSSRTGFSCPAFNSDTYKYGERLVFSYSKNHKGDLRFNGFLGRPAGDIKLGAPNHHLLLNYLENPKKYEHFSLSNYDALEREKKLKKKEEVLKKLKDLRKLKVLKAWEFKEPLIQTINYSLGDSALYILKNFKDQLNDSQIQEVSKVVISSKFKIDVYIQNYEEEKFFKEFTDRYKRAARSEHFEKFRIHRIKKTERSKYKEKIDTIYYSSDIKFLVWDNFIKNLALVLYTRKNDFEFKEDKSLKNNSIKVVKIEL